MTERTIDQVRQAAREALLQGTSGLEIALLFKAADIALEEAETEMQALGFFAQAVTNAEVSKLHVSQGISQPGIASLVQSFRYSKLPSVVWSSSSERDQESQFTEEDRDLSQSRVYDPAQSGAVRRGKF
jgi:hypothetical protein